jgi:hypothetical protein
VVPDNEPTHVTLATVYFRLNRPQDAERERAIVRKLNAESVARARAEVGPGPSDPLASPTPTGEVGAGSQPQQ